ncbi:hypothetical protein YBT020_11335 [Bacillus thuringiensis serovar finitimus YBT-020]|nr:hypothetical protein YBT020_11335 [Bacillus thuringiensis serovar finitimus YBT-020]
MEQRCHNRKKTVLQGNEKIQHAVKTLMEYKWIPGEGKGFAMAGVGNVSGGGQYSLKEAYQYMASKVVKGTGEAIRKINIPSIRNGEFNKWFDELSSKEFNKMWENPKLRKRIEDRIRRPGGYHEWHLVARTPKFKEWGISMNDIKEMRTLTKDVKFVNPPGVHGGEGSTVAHNQILRIIDTSKDYETFVKRLNNWAEDRLESGKMGLPIELRR